jgi:hypothetical protein
MATYRCPRHDVVFETQTDHSKPGTRAKNPEENNRNTGPHVHPQYLMPDGGSISGHPDCPLCIDAVDNGSDSALMEPETHLRESSPNPAPSRGLRVGPGRQVFARG